MNHPRTIKTQCGIDKYHFLIQRKSLFGKIRLYLYVFVATLVDLFKK